MIRLGQNPGDRTKIGICGLSSTEYLIATYGCMSYSMIIVPLYHHYKQDALCQIITNCNIELIFCDTQERANSFLLESDNLPSLKTIVIMKPGKKPGNINGPSMTKPNISLFEWDYLLKLGDTHLKPVTPPTVHDIYIICHTSGTTGTPKGVQLTHRALLAAMAGLYHQWCRPPHRMVFDHKDVYFSFLSLAHVYEQLLQSFIIYVGGRIGIFGGDLKNILEDMQTLKPTLIAMVPRLLNRFYDSIYANIENAGAIKKFLFRKAVTSKTARLNRGIMNYSTLWDKLVFKKIHAMFGGRLRLITTGGAPIAPDVLRFSRLAYGCPVFEGYGQTECSAAGTLSLPFDTQGGHVGGPSSWAHVKLVDVPELGYLAADDKGEICFRGAAIMSGYYGDDALTKEAIDKEGWLHTGDIGQWLPNGALRIIDRK
uniref:long-chain-fatty-acid--CoA ligase n=1 Tax=Plectus sambesii TaxID=2011161 RepID=A0A914UIS7_9BILA